MVPVRGLTVMPHSSLLNPVVQLGLTTAYRRRNKNKEKERSRNNHEVGLLTYHESAPGGLGEAKGGTLTHDALVEAPTGETHANGHARGAATVDGQ